MVVVRAFGLRSRSNWFGRITFSYIRWFIFYELCNFPCEQLFLFLLLHFAFKYLIHTIAQDAQSNWLSCFFDAFGRGEIYEPELRIIMWIVLLYFDYLTWSYVKLVSSVFLLKHTSILIAYGNINIKLQARLVAKTILVKY